MRTLHLVLFGGLCSLMFLPATVSARRDEAEKAAREIIELSVPDDCSTIETRSSTFLDTWPDHDRTTEIRLKQLECEQDWDVVRQQLTNITRTAHSGKNSQYAAERLVALLFLKGDHESVISEAERFLSVFPDSPAVEHILFNEASSLMQLQQYARARQTFLMFILRYPRSPLVAAAQFGLADTYYREEDAAEALEQFSMARKKTNDPLLLAAIELNIASCYQKLGDTSRSIQHYTKVLEILPGSSEAEEATKALAVLKASPGETNPLPAKNVDTAQSRLAKSGSGPDSSLTSKTQDDSVGSGYTLQVGAFSQKDNAFDLLDALKLKDYDAYVITHERSNRIIYKIRIGHCLPRTVATQISQKLMKEENMYSFLTFCSSDEQ